jgi:hypothetical protein
VTALNHSAWQTVLKKGAQALQRGPRPLEPHVLVEALGVERDPKVAENHVTNIRYVGRNCSAKNTPLQFDYEKVTAYNLDYGGHDLGYHRN